MKKCLGLLVFAVAAAMGSAALGQGADVALVNLVSGDVSYVPQAGTPAKVQPFMKVRDGDRINVAVGGQVRIVFFEGARQELWTGPGSFRAGKTVAAPISGKAAQITNLPALVPQRLAQLPDLIQNAKLGGAKVRGVPPRQPTPSLDQEATLARARAAYEKMRQDMPADDITPELYLYAELYEYLAYDQMRAVVAEMRRKQPDNPDAKALEAWVASRMPR